MHSGGASDAAGQSGEPNLAGEGGTPYAGAHAGDGAGGSRNEAGGPITNGGNVSGGMGPVAGGGAGGRDYEEPDGYEIDGGSLDECEGRWCQHFGRCESDDSGAGAGERCVCSPGWTGPYCDVDVDECDAGNPCQNDCTNTPGAFQCSCPERYAGTHCQHLKFQGIGAVAVGLSGDGTTVVGSGVDGSGQGSAVRFDLESGELQTINPIGAAECYGTAINYDGSWLAGSCRSVEGEPSDRPRPFWWRAGEAELFSGELADARLITGVSADATVLIGRWDSNRGFRSSPSGIDELPGTPTGISSDGNAVAIGEPPMRWTPDGSMELLPGEPSWPFPAPLGISADGIGVVGWIDYQDSPRPARREAALWRRVGIIKLGAGQAHACNRDCTLVVGRCIQSREDFACLWDENRQHDVVDLLGATPDLDGWRLSSVVAISEDGKVIAGNGTHDGVTEGWVAHLP